MTPSALAPGSECDHMCEHENRPGFVTFKFKSRSGMPVVGESLSSDLLALDGEEAEVDAVRHRLHRPLLLLHYLPAPRPQATSRMPLGHVTHAPRPRHVCLSITSRIPLRHVTYAVTSRLVRPYVTSHMILRHVTYAHITLRTTPTYVTSHIRVTRAPTAMSL
eukprot:1201495-Rhodomonas_salina.1